MNTINKTELKELLFEMGAELCGFAPVSRFVKAPAGFHPCDVLPNCQTVIVFARRFSQSVLQSPNFAPYSFVRNQSVRAIEEMTFGLIERLESTGQIAVAIPCDEPYEYWDEERQHGCSIVSLKHAAVLAGLGVLGKNTLLINDRLGNMLWLGGVLVDTAYPADPQAEYEGCVSDCSLCIDTCPANALDGTTIVQKSCRAQSIRWTKGGGAIYACHTCRTICPHCTGIGGSC